MKRWDLCGKIEAACFQDEELDSFSGIGRPNQIQTRPGYWTKNANKPFGCKKLKKSLRDLKKNKAFKQTQRITLSRLPQVRNIPPTKKSQPLSKAHDHYQNLTNLNKDQEHQTQLIKVCETYGLRKPTHEMQDRLRANLRKDYNINSSPQDINFIASSASQHFSSDKKIITQTTMPENPEPLQLRRCETQVKFSYMPFTQTSEKSSFLTRIEPHEKNRTLFGVKSASNFQRIDFIETHSVPDEEEQSEVSIVIHDSSIPKFQKLYSLKKPRSSENRRLSSHQSLSEIRLSKEEEND